MMSEHYRINNLDYLEAESIHIMREVAAEFERPIMLYSIGKDSSVMLRLAQKAFYPANIPFPLLHVDTTFKFPEMYEFRERIVRQYKLDLRVYTNHEALNQGANPWDWSIYSYTTAMKTQALLQALQGGRHDAAIGGARRDEEKSRAKERIFSFRDKFGQWDPKNQRPELWSLFNTKINPGESIRVFPISNWTELDVWMYIHKENIDVVPLYFAMERNVVRRDGQLVPVYANSRVFDGEIVENVLCRYRTLGCHPTTCAIESSATKVEDILEELMTQRYSERVTRLIDRDMDGSMEEKKKEGYF